MKEKVSSWLIVLFLIIGIGLGTALGIIGLRDVNRGRPNDMIPVGEYRIVALVKVEPDYALVVLQRRDTESEPRYYIVQKEEVVNFDVEDISSATELIKVNETNLEYIEFK